ncbi:MAG TPA: polysaccharide biosynthesis tyrosine autokinase [Thermoanaerobaculia bacterium]|jgi:capsular exopolysaccharide synthesis family protein|nr:polysaccharide biosynthesis tyrosine autokinase [Thermoanaerobaculia bacterium]
MELNNQEVHLSHYWNVIYKRWKVALSIVAVVMLGTFLASYFSKPLYRSAITVQIERENPNQVTIEDLFGIEGSDQEFLQTQYVLLKSRGLAGQVIDDQKLLSDPDFYPPGINGKSDEQINAIRDGMIGTVLGGLEVTPVRGTSLVEIAYVAPTPRLAKKVAEGYGDSFIRRTLAEKLENVHQATDFLTRQIASVKQELDTNRDQLQRYGESKDIISVDSADNITMQKLMKLNSELTSAQNETFQKRAEYDQIRRSNPESVAGNDPLVMRLTDEETNLERQRQQKLSVFQPQHPEVVRLKNEIDKTRQARVQAVLSAYEKARDTSYNALMAAEGRESSMRAALEQSKHENMKLNVTALTYTDLRAAVESKQAMLDQLTKRLNETGVTGSMRRSNIHWVDHAQLPGGRFNVTMKKNLQSAFPLGVILGLAAIFFLEYMDRSIKTPEELERVTRLASLGVIPSAASVNRATSYSYGASSAKLRAVPATDPAKTGIDLLPHLDSRSPISEAYRAFRTSLLLASANSPKVIVITSTFAREGKTTTSVNLATVLAQMGKPVLLIDADLRRPRLQKVFRGKMNLGLVNYLAANIPLEDVIQESGVPNLSVVLSGPTPPNPSELLASDRMKHLIHEVRAKFAYVIFDSPPVMAVTDSIVLAASADGVVLCVHGGQTPRDLVQRAAERLRQSNIPILGAILNNLDLQQYGYTFKKSYYDYYDSEEDRGEKKPASAPAARKTS